MSRMFWDEKHETMPENKMKALQLEKLKETLRWAYERIPYYKKAFDDAGVRPQDCRALEDLSKFPFTTKTALRDNYPFGLCAVPLSDLARIHASSGTTGKPITGPYTTDDLDRTTDATCRGLWAQDVRPDSIAQVAYTLGPFTGGLGFLFPLTRLGCALVPTGSGMTDRQLLVIQDFGATDLFCTSSYAMTIIEAAEKLGIDLKKTSLKRGHHGAEVMTEEMRETIESRGGIRVYEAYGLTEIGGPGAAFTCECQRAGNTNRWHINEDCVYPEIVDPETLEPLPMGRQGEVVFTTLHLRAMPVIRYRSRDISTLHREKCDCGRTLITMDKVLGRSDDMLIIHGVNLFPSQVESALMEFEEAQPVYQIRLYKKGHSDFITVETEVSPAIYHAGQEKIDEVSKRMSRRIKEVVGINVPVKIVQPETIERSAGAKAKRIIDERSA